MLTYVDFKELAKNFNPKNFIEIYNFIILVQYAVVDNISEFIIENMQLLEKNTVDKIKSTYQYFGILQTSFIFPEILKLLVNPIDPINPSSECSQIEKHYAWKIMPEAKKSVSFFAENKFKKISPNILEVKTDKLIYAPNEKLKELIELVEKMHNHNDDMAYFLMSFGVCLQDIIEKCFIGTDEIDYFETAEMDILKLQDSFNMSEIVKTYNGEFKIKLLEILDNTINSIIGYLKVQLQSTSLQPLDNQKALIKSYFDPEKIPSFRKIEANNNGYGLINYLPCCTIM